MILGTGIIAGDEDRVPAGDTAGVDHDRGGDGVERLDHPRRGKGALDHLAQRIGIGDAERRREALGEIQGIGDVDQQLAGEIGGPRLFQHGEGAVAPGAVDDDLALRGGVGEGRGPGAGFAGEGQCLLVISGTGAHDDVMAELDQLGPDGPADRAGPEHGELHADLPQALRDNWLAFHGVERQGARVAITRSASPCSDAADGPGPAPAGATGIR